MANSENKSYYCSLDCKVSVLDWAAYIVANSENKYYYYSLDCKAFAFLSEDNSLLEHNLAILDNKSVILEHKLVI